MEMIASMDIIRTILGPVENPSIKELKIVPNSAENAADTAETTRTLSYLSSTAYLLRQV